MISSRACDDGGIRLLGRSNTEADEFLGLCPVESTRAAFGGVHGLGDTDPVAEQVARKAIVASQSTGGFPGV